MKKMLVFFLLSPICILIMLGYMQILAKELDFPLVVSKGDNSLLQGIQLETMIETNSGTLPHIFIDEGVSKVDYVEMDFFTFNSRPNLAQRETLYKETPVLDESKKKEVTNAFYHDLNGEICKVYAYPQTDAQLGLEFQMDTHDLRITEYGANIDNTGLMVYSQDDYLIEGSKANCKEVDERNDKYVDIIGTYSYQELPINSASNQDYYIMPIIRPNMDGEASIYRFHETIQERENQFYDRDIAKWEETDRYSFPVSKGMYGITKVVNDTIYLWTWKENVATLQLFDEDLNLIHESKEALPLTSQTIENPEVYQNDEFIIFIVQNQVVVYSLDNGMLIRHNEMEVSSEQAEKYMINDAYYKNDKLYLSANERNGEIFDFNPILLAFDKTGEVYHAKLMLNGQTYEGVNSEFFSIYSQREFLSFVR